MFSFLKGKKKSSEILKHILEQGLKAIAASPEQPETWDDEAVSFAEYSKERDCLFLFAVFSAIQKSKFSETERGFLLDSFREILGGDVKDGKIDAQIEVNLQDYCDAMNAPHPPHLTPLWNVGLTFARHCGADKDITYVHPAAMMLGRMILETVKLLNTLSKSYYVLKG